MVWLAWLWVAASAAAPQSAPVSTPQIYKGLEISVGGLSRAVNVSLSDCPPGANIVRGVIRPGDASEFASVKVDFKVLATFKSGMLPTPVLYGDTATTYSTAQAFGDVGASPSFSCTFAFRVPKGATVTRFVLDTLSFDLAASH
jgi:hypothetical protein